MRPVVTDGVACFCLSVCHDCEPCKNDWDAIWGMDSGGPKEACVRWGCTLAPPGKYDWTVYVWRWCGLFVKLLWPLVLCCSIFVLSGECLLLLC